jgi:hypothetical protein
VTRSEDDFPEAVRAALGGERVQRLLDYRAALSAAVSDAPERTVWPILVPIRSRETGAAGRREVVEFARRISAAEPHVRWNVVFGSLDDGRTQALISDLMPLSDSHPEQFALFDLHPRMSAWRLTALWRAHELAESLLESLIARRPMSAAAAARALAEGIAAFVVESEAISACWAKFKEEGRPDVESATTFRQEMNALLFQAQFGTRVGGLAKTHDALRRTNILSLLRRFGRRLPNPDEFGEWYAWLCDAVHPSFGFQAGYTTQRGMHEAGIQMITEVRRDPFATEEALLIESTIALAAVDIANAVFAEGVPQFERFRWIVDDFGLTTEVAFVSRFDYHGVHRRPRRNDLCVCGSGRKFKSCLHNWGFHLESSIDGEPNVP